MPNATVPAAATGLPEETAILAETGSGLAVVRSAGLNALRPTFLSEEEASAFFATLDAFASADSLDSHFDNTREAMGADPDCKAARKDAKRLRREMVAPLKKVRNAKSKTLDDILFKAMAFEIVDRLECRSSATLAHSIVNDLLSADCMWRAA
ncbi:hypothetical protein [Methylocella sp.]|uniref:hypothetical protein n=1 Tax=Methylocella sp. TaxID=1978226 RepID=UPI003784CCBF